MAVLPSAESAAEWPRPASPVLPPGSSFDCCCHVLPLRTNTQAAPIPLLSAGPPTMAVFPSADTATAAPSADRPIAPEPTILPPDWTNCACAVAAKQRKVKAIPPEYLLRAIPVSCTLGGL